MTAPASGVKIRMYRQGLGDCFLLAFPDPAAARPFYMLIDCGVLLGTQDAGRFVMLQDGGAIDLARTPSLLRTEQLAEPELMKLAALNRAGR